MADENEITKATFASVVEFGEQLALGGVPLSIVTKSLQAAALRLVYQRHGGTAGVVDFLTGALNDARSDLVRAQAGKIIADGTVTPADLAAKVLDRFAKDLIESKLGTADEISAAMLDSAMALRRDRGGSAEVLAWLDRAKLAEVITDEPAGNA